MKAYININQKAFSQLAKNKNIKIDLIDATIFEYIYKFSLSNSVLKQLLGNKLFIWCSYQKIIDDNPLINISSKKAIELRLKKLIDLGLLEKFTDRSKGNKTFFNVTNFAFKLIIENENLSNQDSEGLVSNITNLSNQDSEGVSNEDYYNSKLIDSKLDNIKNTKKEKPQPQKREIGKGDLTPKDVIDFYKENISSLNQKIKEAKAFTQMNLKKIDLEDLLRALKTYADEVKRKKIDEKYLVNLVNFISDDIYEDYLKDEINLIPEDLIGVEFKIDDIEYEFKENGIFNWTKDFLITNEQNIKEYVEMVREHRRSK